MQITIKKPQLVKLNACEEAVVAFETLYGESVTAEWTAEKQVEVLKGPLGRHVGWAFENGLLPLWSMAGADLAGADLARANLAGADLAGADLAGAYLAGAYLARANLARAYLAGAYLVGADLAGADLAGADLAGADLAGAYLARANLAGAYLAGAYLARANLAGAYLAGAKACLCSSAPCVRLREYLAAAGWAPGADGLLARKPKADATAGQQAAAEAAT